MRLPTRPTSPSSGLSPRRADIQGLRALAVVGVLIGHVFGWPRGGFLGVDVFFVISGFLITGLLLREYERTGRVSLADFYRRRVKRILPAAVLVVGVTLVAARLVFNPARFADVVGDALWSGVFASNWHFAATGTDYFTANGPESPLQHFWSLSVEEQFYLAWPLLLLVTIAAMGAGREAASRRLVVAVVGVLITASYVWATVDTASNPTASYFSTFTRAWELGVGALLAACEPLCRRLPRAVRLVAAWVGLAVVVSSFVVVDESSGVPAPMALAPVLGAALVIAAGCGSTRITLPPLTNRFSVALGSVSYSLYLWHFPVLILLAGGTVRAPVLGVVIVVVSVLLAAVTYHLVEKPVIASPLLAKQSQKDRSTAWQTWWTDYGRSLRRWGVGSLVGVTTVVTAAAVIDSRAHPTPAPLSLEAGPTRGTGPTPGGPSTTPEGMPSPARSERLSRRPRGRRRHRRWTTRSALRRRRPRWGRVRRRRATPRRPAPSAGALRRRPWRSSETRWPSPTWRPSGRSPTGRDRPGGFNRAASSAARSSTSTSPRTSPSDGRARPTARRPSPI
ncbi:hypothetical protein GCM10025867_04490 [Frondihabitans sucicola]|uniref:Acyltransferase 3 domain-containing protein n=1 Tax=Frondihabitans sucicola TaxID=1268041 RepID=A0ABN6XTE7_9MICO|nr:hypothetical protein GCM10025867_04490 [Frondihabitans sucicola]